VDTGVNLVDNLFPTGSREYHIFLKINTYNEKKKLDNGHSLKNKDAKNENYRNIFVAAF